MENSIKTVDAIHNILYQPEMGILYFDYHVLFRTARRFMQIAFSPSNMA